MQRSNEDKGLVINKNRRKITVVKKSPHPEVLNSGQWKKAFQIPQRSLLRFCSLLHHFKSELPPESRIWFDDSHLHVDLGFWGICKDYPAQQISIHFKKSKNKPLTEDHKISNKRKCSVRVRVEHSIGGLKRFRFLSDRLSCRDIQLYNLVAGVCAVCGFFVNSMIIIAQQLY